MFPAIHESFAPMPTHDVGLQKATAPEGSRSDLRPPGGVYRDRSHRAILLMIGAMLAFAILDGLRKALSDTVPASVIVATRYLTFVLVVLGWLRNEGRALFASNHVALQVLRSAVMVAEAVVFVYALRYASLADASAVFALAPIAGVFLAVCLLGERAMGATWIALIVSFLGILIILRPAAHSHQTGLWLALLSALLYALYGVLTRKVSDLDSTRTSFSYMTVIGLLLVAVLAAVQTQEWRIPTTRDGLLLALAAIAAGMGQYLLISAYSKAPASTLQPYNYFLFAWSVPISVIFFAAPPSRWALVGTILVIGSGAYLFLSAAREREPTSPGR